MLIAKRALLTRYTSEAVAPKLTNIVFLCARKCTPPAQTRATFQKRLHHRTASLKRNTASPTRASVRAKANFGPLVTARSQAVRIRHNPPVRQLAFGDERQKVTSLLSHAFVALNEKPPLSVEMPQTVLRDGIGQRGVGRMGDRATTAACVGSLGIAVRQVMDLPSGRVICFGRTMSCPTTDLPCLKTHTAFAHIDLSLINAQMSPVRARRKP